jgi:hypothetical protein
MGASRKLKMAAILAAFPKTKRPSDARPGYTSASIPSVELCLIPLGLFDDSARHCNSMTGRKICSD